MVGRRWRGEGLDPGPDEGHDVAAMDAMRQDGLVYAATVARVLKEMGVDPDTLAAASV